ncbi:putative glycerol kinase 5 isoform X2 [Anthonomus grandis grandis]|uniref:putative glycerol kinase 5 isoform X2 n=1 Tax=Anthonomus grandis grandis TaxID=2921223 RepID=UPI002166BEE3|nr:putative glycerol kinase 5 isoform X2 [Anthonomus grandis grandis]
MPDGPGYIASLDIGTTTIRCQIFDSRAKIRGNSFDQVKIHFGASSGVEIDPDELWDSIIQVVKTAVQDAEISISEVKSLAIATQRATFITWRRDTGQHLHRFITWKDLSAVELTKKVNSSWRIKIMKQAAWFGHFITRITSLGVLSHINFASTHVSMRFLHILQTNQEVQEALQQNNLLFGTVDTWIIYKLTGGQLYVTDISNASATGLYDPFNLCWSFIPRYIGIGKISFLPTVVENDFQYGETLQKIFGVPIKIGAVMSDQSASMYGSGCCKENDVKLTLGTGAFLNLNTGQHIRRTAHGLYPLVGWKISKKMVYLTEVACSDAGSLIQWLMENESLQHPEDLTKIATSVKDNGGVYFIPAFSGLGPPFNNETATSGFIGIKPDTKRAHMVRAVLESIVYRTTLAYNLLEETCGSGKRTYIRLDGGVSKSDFICQLLSNLTNLLVKRVNLEMATLGAALLAGQLCDFWKDPSDVVDLSKVEDIFKPTNNETIVKEIKTDFRNWQIAAQRFMNWYG